MWTAFSRPCTSTYVPWYAGITETPHAYRTGTNEYKKNSAWWAFERLGDIVDRRYQEKTQNVRDAWAKLETEKLQGVSNIEETALQLYNGGDVTGARNVLTKYSCAWGIEAVNLAKQLSKKKLRFIRTWF